MSKSGARDLSAFLASNTFQDSLNLGRVVRTNYLGDADAQTLLAKPEIRELFDSFIGGQILEHEAVPFPSFPYEWSPEMLHAAGHLTLDLAQSLVSEGLGLKDATPYNILFRGPVPVFVDLLSFEQRDPNDPIWLAQAQFERTFLLPLLVNKRFGISIEQVLAARRDGLEPEEVYRVCGKLQRLSPTFLTLVSMPAWLASRQSQDDSSIYEKKSSSDPEKARFILGSSFKRLRRLLDKLEPESRQRSAWSDYMTKNNYCEGQFKAKQSFVEQAMNDFRPRRVLDVGSNTGHFSRIAARCGASVVAIDYDPVVAGHTWREARLQNLDILPLVIDLGRPSPAIGWRNSECPGFLDRACNFFDAVMMLAVIHHLLVSERIPLTEIIDLGAELTTDLLIIEFIAPEDSMFRRLTRGRDRLFSYLTRELFEDTCSKRFEIAHSEHEDGTWRWLYVLRKREAAAND